MDEFLLVGIELRLTLCLAEEMDEHQPYLGCANIEGACPSLASPARTQRDSSACSWQSVTRSTQSGSPPGRHPSRKEARRSGPLDHPVRGPVPTGPVHPVYSWRALTGRGSTVPARGEARGRVGVIQPLPRPRRGPGRAITVIAHPVAACPFLISPARTQMGQFLDMLSRPFVTGCLTLATSRPEGGAASATPPRQVPPSR